MLRDALWPIDTTVVVFVVEGVFVQLSLSLGGVSALFGTSTLSLAHPVPILLVHVDGERWRCMYPNLPLSVKVQQDLVLNVSKSGSIKIT
jgi:hypothetical protein